MDISKEAEVKAAGQIHEDDLQYINSLTRRELKPEEVYTFAVRLCDNEIDRDLERFDEDTLEELGKLFVGVSGVFDHQWSARGQAARIYRTEVIREASLTADGRPYCWLKGWAYMMRTKENEPLIAEIDGGINLQNAPEVVAAGTDILVAGSAVFNAEDVAQRVAEFKKI